MRIVARRAYRRQVECRLARDSRFISCSGVLWHGGIAASEETHCSGRAGQQTRRGRQTSDGSSPQSVTNKPGASAGQAGRQTRSGKPAPASPLPSPPRRRRAGKSAPAGGRRRFGQVLIDLGFLDEDQLWEVLEEAKNTAQPVGQVAMARGLINEDQLLQALGEQHGLKVANLQEVRPQPEALQLVPETMASVYKVVPLSFKDKVLTIAIGDPNNLAALDDLRNLLNITEVQAQLGHAPGHRRDHRQNLRRQGREHHRPHPGDREQSRTGQAPQRNQHRPRRHDGDGQRGPRPQAHQHGVPAGHQGPRQRHPFRAVRGRVQDALSLRRRAV